MSTDIIIFASFGLAKSILEIIEVETGFSIKRTIDYVMKERKKDGKCSFIDDFYEVHENRRSRK